MKRFLLLAAVCLTACSGKDFIPSRAEHFVRRTYSDVDRIVYLRVDTVTFGDNLDYRIEQARRSMEFAAMMKRTYGGERYESDLAEEKAWVDALDSLKAATAPEVLAGPVAFNCTVAYNHETNFVWVQLDPLGNLLGITKDRDEFLLNPGGDVPGYFELWKKFHDR